MSNITKIRVADTTYDIKDNISGYITKDVNDLTNYYDKNQVDYNIEQVSGDIPTRTSQLTNDSGFVGTAALAGKQDTLISGSNIKTINGANILGSGNLVVESQGEINLVDDIKMNGVSILNNKVADFYISDHYSSTNGIITNYELQNAIDAVEAEITAQGRLIPTKTSNLINDSNFISSSALDNYALSSETANSMTMEVNTDYVLTSKLKDKNGLVIDTATVDLPIEGLVMNGRYDTATKKIVLTLKNGNTIEFSIADLISDRQPLIDSTHKLDSDLINTTGQTNQFVLASDKANWNAKQSPIVAGTGITLSGSQVSVTNYNSILSSINSKQDLLTSGVNIKTINNQSLLGSGNINIQGGGSGGTSTDVQINGASITANDIANIVVWGDYDPTTNPLVTAEKVAFEQVNILPEVRNLNTNSTSAEIIEAFGGIDILEMVIEAIENPYIHLVTTILIPTTAVRSAAGGSNSTYLDITKREWHENHWELGATGHGFDWYLAFERNGSTYSVVRAYNYPLVDQTTYEDYSYNNASYEVNKGLVYVKTGNTVQLFGEAKKTAGSAAASFTSVPNGWAPVRNFYYQYTEVNIPEGSTYYSNPVSIDSWGNIWIEVSSSTPFPATGILDGFTYIISPYSTDESGSSCFAANTKVYGEEEKTISELKIGDKVYSYDHKADTKVLDEVTNIRTHEGIIKVVEITCGEDKIICTPEHALFAVERPYAQAGEMRPGYHIFNAEQELVEITNIEQKEVNTITGYDIDTNNHNYFVGDNKLLAHTEHITMDHE